MESDRQGVNFRENQKKKSVSMSGSPLKSFRSTFKEKFSFFHWYKTFPMLAKHQDLTVLSCGMFILDRLVYVNYNGLSKDLGSE